tara:strand:+ start:417 stop:533 length:117 start_codon:yes stop_codon:yes gene_type:complete
LLPWLEGVKPLVDLTLGRIALNVGTGFTKVIVTPDLLR